MYLPVSTDEIDKINICYEGISDLIMTGLDNHKKAILIGDFNSHIYGW